MPPWGLALKLTLCGVVLNGTGGYVLHSDLLENGIQGLNSQTPEITKVKRA